MGIIWTIIIGLIVGVIGRFLVPGKDPMGWVATILLGIGGAIVGSFLGSLLDGEEGVSIDVVNTGVWGWVLSIVGAVILILIYRQVKTRT
ncbi:MAG TPA: GlsB/YeaQ/YmgE family stress response membrane protein [Acidimicrobiia bacterium]|nr:GlsB/YeaQ/YmgE family stress response membrane protein [Acidimicrobiia bacterium]